MVGVPWPAWRSTLVSSFLDQAVVGDPAPSMGLPSCRFLTARLNVPQYSPLALPAADEVINDSHKGVRLAKPSHPARDGGLRCLDQEGPIWPWDTAESDGNQRVGAARLPERRLDPDSG